MLNFKKLKKTFIVAEISANHGQKLDRALELIKEASQCGVDAVKFQTYTPDTLTLNVKSKYFQLNHSKWQGHTLYQLYKNSYTPWSWFKRLKQYAESLGLVFFSTSYDQKSVDFLESLGVNLHKIASFELVDIPLIKYIGKTKKPLIISTGMGSIQEIKESIQAARKGGSKDIILLKCVSDYPANPTEINLATISDMKKKFHYPVGFSDHSLDIGVSIAAVCYGAKLIEKHFTVSRKIETADSFFSLEPKELKSLATNIKIAEKAKGKIFYGSSKKEKKNRVFRRSLFIVKDIKKGDILSESNVRSIRPSYGLAPKYLKQVLGKKIKKDTKKGTPLTWGMLK